MLSVDYSLKAISKFTLGIKLYAPIDELQKSSKGNWVIATMNKLIKEQCFVTELV